MESSLSKAPLLMAIALAAAPLAALPSGCGGRGGDAAGSDADAGASGDSSLDGRADASSDAAGDSGADGAQDAAVDGATDGDTGSDGATDAEPDADADAPVPGEPLCLPEHGPVTPIGMEDQLYTAWADASCLSYKCLCDDVAEPFLSRLLACEAVLGGFFWEFGSVAVRVVGREAGACVIEVASDVEMWISVQHCRVPLPMAPWAGLSAEVVGEELATHFIDGIEEHCEDLGGCCLFGCPPPCDETDLDPYVCMPGGPVCSD